MMLNRDCALGKLCWRVIKGKRDSVSLSGLAPDSEEGGTSAPNEKFGLKSKCKSKLTFNEEDKLTKEQIRSKILLRLKTQKEEERSRKSRIIKDKLFRMPVFKKAKIVMFYIAFGGEVDTKDMIEEARKLEKIIAVPVCEKNRIMKPSILPVKAKLRRGLYGIYEPAIKQFINLKDLDLVIVPGVAFNKKGVRLGRGKGYYDCLLKKVPDKTFTIGLAFKLQIISAIPSTPTDVRINKVICA